MTQKILSLVSLSVLAAAIGCTSTSRPTPNTANGVNNAMGELPPAQADAGTAAPTEVPTPPPPPPMARVRVIHASPDPAAATVAIAIDNTPAVPSLAYKAVAGYVEFPAGAHAVAVRPASAAADSTPVVQAQTPALEANHSYTVIAHGLAGAEPALALTPVEDNTTAAAENHANIRFFHALVGVANVDICVAGANARAAGTPVFTNVAYGAFGTVAGGSGQYFDAPAGAEVALQVRAANTRRPCSGAIAGVVRVTPPSTGVVTAVAVGRVRPAVTRELLVCTDTATGASACNAVAIAAR